MKRLRLTRIALLAAWMATLVCSLSWAAAQETTSPSPTTTFKTTVRRVVLDVVVTDSSGKAVPGLSKDDFRVTEDNKPQQILSFDPYGFDSGMDYVPVKLPSEPVNSFVNLPTTPEKGPLYVLLYDMVNMDNPAQMSSPGDFKDQMYGRQQLVKFIQSKPEGSRFAIFVWSDGLHLVQGFTSDKALLYTAVDPKNPKAHIPPVFMMGPNFGQGNTTAALGVLNFIANYLDGLPGRKNLIWMSGQFPLSLFPTDDDVPSYAEQIKATLDLVARDQIAIYPVDVRGVTIDNPHAAQGATSGGGLVSDARDNGLSAPGQSSSGATRAAGAGGVGSQGYSLLAQSYMVMDGIAEATGGKAFYSRNDVSVAMTDATNAGASYYTLTYSPSNKEYDGKLRNIRVGLDKKGYQLAYRRSYFGADADAPLIGSKSRAAVVPIDGQRRIGDTLYANMEHGAPIAHQLIFGAHLRTIGAPAKGTTEQMAQLSTQPAFFKVRRHNAPPKPLAPIDLQRYAIDYTILARQLQIAGSVPRLEIAAAAYDADGLMLNAVVNNATSQTNAQTPQSKPYRAEQLIDVPSGAKSIRVAVRDMNTDRIGAMEVMLPLAAEGQAKVD